MGKNLTKRHAVIGIVLMMIGAPMYFLSTSWLEYVGIVLALAGGILIILTLVRGRLT